MGTCKNRLIEAVLTSTHKLCFEQKYEKYQKFLAENVHFLVVKFSVYLNRHVFVMPVLPAGLYLWGPRPNYHTPGPILYMLLLKHLDAFSYLHMHSFISGRNKLPCTS